MIEDPEPGMGNDASITYRWQTGTGGGGGGGGWSSGLEGE